MLLDAMTGEPEWCGALAAVSLHRQTLKRGEEGRGGALLKHRNLRKKREKRTTTGGMKLLELADGLQPRISGFCDYHRNPKPQACRKRSSMCSQQHHEAFARERMARGRDEPKKSTQRQQQQSVAAGGLTGAGDERGGPPYTSLGG